MCELCCKLYVACFYISQGVGSGKSPERNHFNRETAEKAEASAEMLKFDLMMRNKEQAQEDLKMRLSGQHNKTANSENKEQAVVVDEKALRDAFHRFDADGSGSIDRAELLSLMCDVYGNKLGRHHAAGMLEHDRCNLPHKPATKNKSHMFCFPTAITMG